MVFRARVHHATRYACTLVHVTQVLCICQSRKIPQRLTAVSPAVFPARARVSGCTGTRYQQFIRSRWMPRLEPRNLGGMPLQTGGHSSTYSHERSHLPTGASEQSHSRACSRSTLQAGLVSMGVPLAVISIRIAPTHSRRRQKRTYYININQNS